MKLETYLYKCATCNKEFNDVELQEGSYGEFILRTSNNEMALLKSLSSKEFDEVAEIVNHNPAAQSWNKFKKAEVIQNVFGITCDQSPTGKTYHIGKLPICPNCKSNNIASWQPLNPPQFIEKDIPSVTHNTWNKLTQKEKEEKINIAIKNYTSNA